MSKFSLNEKVGPLKSHPMLKRYEKNPIFTKDSVPYPLDLAFNAGVVKHQGRYIMAFRGDRCGENVGSPVSESFTGLAFSDDGVRFEAADKPLRFHYKGQTLERCNDARLSVVDDEVYLSFCFNSFHGERPGIALLTDKYNCDVVYLGVPAQRNLILSPYKHDGYYWRLERPNSARCPGRNDIWIAFSKDLKYWGEAELLLGVEDVPYANVKVGGGTPPIKTAKGYLFLFHAVDDDADRVTQYPTFEWTRRYTAGAALLDLENPQRLIGVSQSPILVAETSYETGAPNKFYREDVVFPCGITRENNNLFRIYYGAGDLWQCLAEIREDDLLSAITSCPRQAEYATLNKMVVL